MRNFMFILASLALGSTAAQAFEAPQLGDATSSKFNWSGPYVGAQLGYSSGTAYQGWEPAPSDYSKPDPRGALLGLYLGYNYQLDNAVVLGLDGDINWSGAKGQSVLYYSYGSAQPDIFNTDFDVKWNGALRARAGYAFDRFMPYVAAGPTLARAKFTYFDRGSVSETFEANYLGWTVGLGAEYAITDNVIGRFEYRHSDFGNVLSDDNRVSFKSDTVHLGIAFKF